MNSTRLEESFTQNGTQEAMKKSVQEVLTKESVGTIHISASKREEGLEVHVIMMVEGGDVMDNMLATLFADMLRTEGGTAIPRILSALSEATQIADGTGENLANMEAAGHA